MSVESPGESKKIAVISTDFAAMKLNNGNSMEYIRIGNENLDDEFVENGAEIFMLSLPPVTISSECCSENESENSFAGLGKLNVSKATTQSTLLTQSKAIALEPHFEKQRAIRTAVTIKRAMSLPRTSLQPKRHVPPLRQSNNNNGAVHKEATSLLVSQSKGATRIQTQSVRPQKPNSLPQVQSRTYTSKRGVSNNVPTDNTSYRIRPNLLSVELKTMTGNQNPYGTVPRRRKQKSVEDLQTNRASELRSNSINRDMRMSTSIGPGSRKTLQLYNSSGVSSNNSSAWTTPTHPYAMNWPNSARKSNVNSKTQKTRIFYEQSVQTTLTNSDIGKLLEGSFVNTQALNSVCNDQETQCSDIRDYELDRLREQVQLLSTNLQRERDEKVIMQRELQLNTERVMNMLELIRLNSFNGSAGGWTPTSEDDVSSCSVSGHDSLLMLESQIQLSGHELVERQHEIGQLRQLCRSLQTEMHRSVLSQQSLLQEKAAIEEESNEMQDFLQHEKAAMFDALRDLEADYDRCKTQLAVRDDDVKALREKCRYLVRLNEQRRQENLLIQTKLTAFKTKSMELINHEHSVIAVALAALSKLHLRLKSLVDELKLTYNLSEQDLELQLIQQMENQTEVSAVASSTSLILESHDEYKETKLRNYDDKRKYFQSVLDMPRNGINNIPDNTDDNGDTDDRDDDGGLSPERHQSFIAAIIGAIRSAATPSKRSLQNSTMECRNVVGFSALTMEHTTNNGNQTECFDAGDMLESETEPCLMMDNVLHEVKMADTHTANLVSSNDMENVFSAINIESVPSDKLSLHNLSQAIVNRQNIEKCTNNDFDFPDEMSHALIKGCPDVKALIEKVCDVDVLVTRLLRLIQMDNDNCIQQLIVDKNKLQQHKEEMLDKIRELQQINVKLQDDLMDATQELMIKNNELAGKKDLQSHHNEIDLKQKEPEKMTMNTNFPNTSPIIKKHQSLEFSSSSSSSSSRNKTVQHANSKESLCGCEVMDVMSLLTKLHTQTTMKYNEATKTVAIHDIEGNLESKITEDSLQYPSPNQLEDILNTFDTVDNLNDIDAEVQQTIQKLKENWSALCLSKKIHDFGDTTANAN